MTAVLKTSGNLPADPKGDHAMSTITIPTPTSNRSVAPVPATDPGEPGSVTVATWRAKGIGVLRIVFGLVWLVDAAFKWSPSFINKFGDYLTGAKDGQPQLVKDWIDFWVRIVNVDPHVFAHLIAIGETAVAIGLILGLFSNLTYATGALLATVIWTTAEGLGGPYKAGSTDIGAAIIYTMVFAGLYLAMAGRQYGLDTRVGRRLKGRWAHLASGPVPDSVS